MHIDDDELREPIRRYRQLRESAVRYSWCTAGAVALAGLVGLLTLSDALARAGSGTDLWTLVLGLTLAGATLHIARGALLPELTRLDLIHAHRALTQATRDALARRGLDLAPGWRAGDITRGRLTVVDRDGHRRQAHVRCVGCDLGVAGHFKSARPQEPLV